MKAFLILFFALTTALGGYLGWVHWGALIGILGGAFLGLLIGVAAFYCVGILIGIGTGKSRPSDGA